MALDHVRDFWHKSYIVPTDILRTTSELFATRWITHFCAPIFFLLAGIAIYFTLQKWGGQQTARFLILRGILLILLEIVLFSPIWTGGRDTLNLQVIWALGASMVAMGLLIGGLGSGRGREPSKPLMTTALLLGTVLILGHNALDSYPQLLPFLHLSGYTLQVGSKQVYILYPLIPWIGVMALGFAMGPLFSLPRERRFRLIFLLGILMTALFFTLRFANSYGDPTPWKQYPTLAQTLMSFLNCEKYPPSLMYLAMTLGPSLLVLAILDRFCPKASRFNPLIVLGQTPLFFYICHLPLIYGLRMIANGFIPDFRGLGLPGTYGIWILILILLLPICYTFRRLKSTTGWKWLSYF